jgi:hypothetical protein
LGESLRDSLSSGYERLILLGFFREWPRAFALLRGGS